LQTVRRWRILLLAAGALAVGVAAAGCGGGDKTTESSTQKWASGVCTAVTTYVDSLRDAAATFQANVSAAGLADARDEAETATESFTATVEGLGKPDTESGKRAKQALDALAVQLGEAADDVKQATESITGTAGLVNAISVVTTTLAAARNQITTTVDELRELDQGELKQAFAGADSCTALVRD
jgi:hypothetical protein